MVSDIQDLNDLQQKVVRATYLVVVVSIVVVYLVFKSQDYVLSIFLGTALSLLAFNSKFNSLKKNIQNKRAFIGSSTGPLLVSYGLLFVILLVVKLYTDLNIWLVFGYAISSNILLIIIGYRDAWIRKRKLNG